MMEIILHASREYDAFLLKGEIKISTLATISSTLSKHIEKNSHKDLVLDLSQVEYIDSSGLRMLINLQKKLESAKKRVYLLNPSTQTMRLLDETKTSTVFTTIPSIDTLEQRIAADVHQKFLPYTSPDKDLLKLHLSCAVCGSENVTGYLFDLNGYDWKWADDDPYPTSFIQGSSTPIDVLGHLPIVCLDCCLSSINPNDFNVMNGASIAIKSVLNDTLKLLLSKSIKKRKRMLLDEQSVTGEFFFHYPRKKNASYMAYALAEFCTRTLSVNKETSNPYLVGFLSYLCLRFAKLEEKPELINNCRTWFTQALNQIDRLSEVETAISYMAILLADINLEKYNECYKVVNSIKEHQATLTPGQNAATFLNPNFWHTQALFIWQKEMDTKSQILK
jgi:anti-sigma B factor antagonist